MTSEYQLYGCAAGSFSEEVEPNTVDDLAVGIDGISAEKILK